MPCLWGSRLALDILADGTARQYPGYEVRFTRIALQLARIPDPEACARLAAIFHDDLESLFVEVIEDRLGQTSFWGQLGGWHLLASLADRDISWALKMLEGRWPADIEAQKTILWRRRRKAPSKWYQRKLISLAPRIEPHVFYSLFRGTLEESQIPSELVPFRRIVVFFEIGRERCDVPVRSVWSDVLSRIFFTPMHVGNDLLQSMERLEFSNKDWDPLLAAVRFGVNPSAKSLATELSWLAERWSPSESDWLPPLPWPFGVCMNRAKSNKDLLRFAEAAQAGALGDAKHWAAAEQRWRQIGLLDEDFFASDKEAMPISPEFEFKGFPFEVSSGVTNDTLTTTDFIASLQRLKETPNGETASWLAELLVSLLESSPGRRMNLSPSHFKPLYEIAFRRTRKRWRPSWLDNLIAYISDTTVSADGVDFLDWLGRQGRDVSIDAPRQNVADDLIRHFCVNPDGRRGLLPIIAELAKAGCHCIVPQHVLSVAKTWDTCARLDAIGLSLGDLDATDNEITDAATELSRSDAQRGAWDALRIVSFSSLKQAAKLALELLMPGIDSSKSESNIADYSRRVLQEFLTNKPSLLQDPAIWKRLNLPERL